ncbi:hypothetical protein CONPUDRAFT_65253 [Coniophora puteana RWD-64-598 SS2]|uniref:Uncharacterized protein n=1 Tax=Coniophora puteana (strain RWD-64-598) TaxID=741705 RepID=A0A5M3MAL6_CONPW|nr:uncharacterized protein CONPUDRAFT_65253 [Coniophora puteana RWD-64-598 SS2]EIW76016.1 hypothetical protein CONPUDRAFT_65253 [Coniophora puteana RWD-64-598 SS2]
MIVVFISNNVKGTHFSEDGIHNIHAFNFKVNAQLDGQDYTKLQCSKLVSNIKTLHHLQSHMSSLSLITPVNYHCCPNSCICYTGDYQHFDHCPHYSKSCYDNQG